jgi:hypothetical protein
MSKIIDVIFVNKNPSVRGRVLIYFGFKPNRTGLIINLLRFIICGHIVEALGFSYEGVIIGEGDVGC